MSAIRRFRQEAMWLSALLVVTGWMVASAPKVEARSTPCIYHTYTNWCYEYDLDCLCWI